MAGSDAAALVEALERRVLLTMRGILTVVGLPALAFVHGLEWVHGEPSWWVGSELVATAITTALLWSGASHTVRCGAVVAQPVVMSVVALLHFGPTIGTGLFFLATTLGAAFFFGRRAAALVVLLLAALLIGAAAGLHAGLIHPVTFSPPLADWARMTAATVITLAGCAVIFVGVQESMRDAIVAEIAARHREHEAQIERERVLQSAEKNQRLEALGRLAGGVAHDFNNALTVIRSAAELLRSFRTDAERADLLDDVDDGIQRASTTARQLLAFARKSPLEGTTTDPAARIEHLARSVARMLPAGVSIAASVEATPPIELAPGAFDQVLLNLVLNARDAMPGGGHITVSCRDEGGSAVVEVRDDGSGMTPEVRARAFEPFYTTKGDLGTGLGLAMVWGLVTRCSGTVDLESSPGKGTLVRLRFAPAAGGSNGSAAPSSSAPPRAGRVLVLEDQPDVARALRRLLETQGLTVSAVGTTQDARRRISEADHDLLLTDAMLPDGPVAPVIVAFQAKHPRAMVIVCSGHVEGSLALDGVSSESLRFLPKPFATAELESLVADGLRLAGTPAPS